MEGLRNHILKGVFHIVNFIESEQTYIEEKGKPLMSKLCHCPIKQSCISAISGRYTRNSFKYGENLPILPLFEFPHNFYTQLSPLWSTS